MIYEIAEKCEKEVKKICDDYEVYVSTGKTIELDSKNDELNFAKEEITQGIGIRILKDNKMGFAFTSDLNKINQTALQALENTKLNNPDKNYAFSQEEKVNKIDKLYDKKFENLDLDETIDFLNNIITKANETKCEVTSAGFSASRGESIILNSNGVSIADKSTGFGAGLSVNIEEKGNVATAYDSVSSRFYDLDGDKLAEDVCKLAMESVDTKPVETNDYDVVLDYYAATGLLSTFLAAFNGENVQRRRSILHDKMNSEIVSSNLSITNDATLEKGMYSAKCDGEGTVSKKTNLVENGVLKSFMYDIYTANKENTTSTGNGYRNSYLSTPSVSPSNIILDFDEKIGIGEIAQGVLTTSVLGAHTANPISGDFSVEASNAFKIENGEISYPINKAMISGNIFEILKKSEGVKSEIKQYGPFILPKILVHNLRVVGQH